MTRSKPKTRARLGIDLDEVVFRYFHTFRPFAAKELGRPEEDLRDPAFYSLVASGWFNEEEHYRQVHGTAVDAGLYRDLEVIEGASENLWKLNDEGFTIHIITSRFVNKGQHGTVISQTGESLDKNNIPFHSITFDGLKYEHNADVYLDDAPHNIETLRKEGKFVVIFDTTYNRHIDGLRVKNWEEFYQIVTDRFPATSE